VKTPEALPLLPESGRPQRLAEANTHLHGLCLPEHLPRLVGQCIAVDPLEVWLDFGRDDQGRLLVSGRLEGRVTASCQRCLAPVEIALAGDFQFFPEEDSDDLFAPVKAPVPATDAPLALRHLAEDEALLLCPMIPRHEEDACRAAVEMPDEAPMQRENPFDVLASLRHNSADQSPVEDRDRHSEE
jgi:uncharacterized protein